MNIFSVIIFLSVAGCAGSSGWRMPDNDGASTAPGAAFAGDGMNFRKDMPHREKFKPWDFYYKHCAVNGDETVYSATSYDCSGPSF